jgi:shikimate dehydrogenase
VDFELVLLGDPVEHSLSPVIHNAALAATGLSGRYAARRVGENGVRAAFAELRSGQLHGLNITMPHKALAAQLCDYLEPDALRAGSVNTAYMTDGAVRGLSTDIDGIRDVWRDLPRSGPVLVLGAGGAAAAACIALADHPLYGAARRGGPIADMARKVALDLGEVRWGVPVVEAVVVNCTPLGMKGESLPEAVLALAGGILDMTYGPATTPAVRYVASRGKPTISGLDLLVAQAARSFSVWTGLPAPLGAMRKALGNP